MSRVEQAGRTLIIVGASGHARKVVDLARTAGYAILGYLSTEPRGTMSAGFPVLGYIEQFEESAAVASASVHIAIGDNAVRRRLFETLRRECKFATLISASAVVSDQAVVGIGTSIHHYAVVQCTATIGNCSIIDTGAIVEHDCEVGEFVNVSPGAIVSGGVAIGSGAIIGAGAVIREKCKIGPHALVGAGSVVTRDVPSFAVAYGNPARVVRTRTSDERYLR